MTNAKHGKRWSYSAGERGINRVRAFERATTGRIFLEFYEAIQRGVKPKVRRVGMGRCDRERAKHAAEELAARLRRAEVPQCEHPTLVMLFDNYLREVTPGKTLGKQSHDRRCAGMFVRAFGADTEARLLSRRELDRFVRDRRSGAIAASHGRKGYIVRARCVAYDLAWLSAVMNWATMVSDGRGGVLLTHNPLKGYPMPREENPHRPRLAPDEYERLLEVASSVAPLFPLALVLAHETGHRIGAIRMLRWSDVDFDGRVVRWRAENDKIGLEHTTPLTDVAAERLQVARRAQSAIGDAFVFPSPSDAGVPCSRHLVRDWWERGAALAELPKVARRGWHSLRRQFATEMKNTPLPDLCRLGGWKDPQTVLTCYQQPDPETMRAALAQRKRIAKAEAQ
ncbi:MAG: tyrosine-type recombinase/integrase [Gemmatimonadaceae bacterium]